MVERVRNVIKQDRKKGKRLLDEQECQSNPKIRAKAGCELLRRYPVSTDTTLVPENAGSIEQHEKAIKKELDKSKPREMVLLPLMKSTYQSRQMYVLNEASSVDSILQKYPALSFAIFVNFRV